MIRICFVARHLDRNGCWSVEARVEDVGFGWRHYPCEFNHGLVCLTPYPSTNASEVNTLSVQHTSSYSLYSTSICDNWMIMTLGLYR